MPNENDIIYFPDGVNDDPRKSADGDNNTIYTLRQPFQYTTLKGQVILVPCGFQTDEVSAPRATWSLIGLPPDGYYRDAGVVHDFLYSNQGMVNGLHFTRKDCDLVLLEILKRLEVPMLQRTLAYLAVRLFGGSHWKK